MFVCLFSAGCETRTLVFLGEYSTSELQAGLERSFFQKNKQTKKQTNKKAFQTLNDKIVVQIIETEK